MSVTDEEIRQLAGEICALAQKIVTGSAVADSPPGQVYLCAALRGCVATLRELESLTRDTGTLVIEAGAAIGLAGRYKLEQLSKAAAAVELGQVTRTPGGTYWVPASDGDSRYLVDRSSEVCSCPAGQHGRRCWHLAAADILHALHALEEGYSQ